MLPKSLTAIRLQVHLATFFHANDVRLFLYDPLFVICHHLPCFAYLDQFCNAIWWQQNLVFVTSDLHAFINYLFLRNKPQVFYYKNKATFLNSRSTQPLYFSWHLYCFTCACGNNSPMTVSKCCFVFDIDWSSTIESPFTSSQPSEVLLS